MAKEKAQMPMAQAGLIRYFDEESQGIQLKPEWVVGFGIMLGALVVVMRLLV
ncbi:MAG: preprotein translocase subunit Sec61beta [Candidatus Aenigmatarchaeota archaeon]